jgi:Phosphotransferase enzyme family
MMTTTHTPLNIGPVSEPMVTPDWGTIRRTFQRFATLVDAVPILRSCVPELSTGSFEIRDCVILDAKLKTYLKPTSKNKSTLSACYQLTLREGATGPSFQRIVYIKVFLGGRSREAFCLLAQKGISDPEFQNSVSHVPEYDLILWRFPHDPALPHLRQLVDLLAVEQYLPVDGLRQIGIQGTAQVLTQQVMNYRPEIRCTNRYTLYDATHDRTCQLFGKTFGDSQGQTLYERLQYFWNRSLADQEAMSVAQPLGYSTAINTVWQLGVPGTPLLHVLNTSNYKPYIAAVAKGLASLHTSDIRNLAAHSPENHLIETRKKLTKLSNAIPQLSEMFENVANDIEQTTPHSSTIPFRPIHWDFHVDQLLADNGTLVFCDLDELVIGDPLQDLANFVVDLQFRHTDQEFVRLITSELCHQYQRLVDWPVSVERFVWHVRLQLVNKAYRHYLRFAPDFEEIVERSMRLAQRGILP